MATLSDGRRRVCLHTLRRFEDDVRARRLAQALFEAGYDVFAVDVDHDSTLPKWDYVSGIPVRHIQLPSVLRQFYEPKHTIVWLAFKAVRMLAGAAVLMRVKADVYHASDLAAFPGTFAAAFVRKRAIVVELYEAPLVQPHITRLPLVPCVGNWILRWSFPKSSAVITVSDPIRRFVEKRFRPKRSLVIRNVPDLQVVAAADHLRRHLSLSREVAIALYQGSIQENRGLDLLIDVAEYLPSSVVIVVMGDGPAKARLAEAAVKRGVESKLRLTAPVPYDQLLAWTGSADVGLTLFPPDFSPSIRWSLPNKLFEYLMAGVPVLSSELPAIQDVLEEYGVGQVVASRDPRVVAGTLVKMLADKDRLSAMSIRARTVAAEVLNWEVEKQPLVELYAQLSGRQAVRRDGVT